MPGVPQGSDSGTFIFNQQAIINAIDTPIIYKANKDMKGLTPTGKRDWYQASTTRVSNYQ